MGASRAAAELLDAEGNLEHYNGACAATSIFKRSVEVLNL
jgi:hypothetical protein